MGVGKGGSSGHGDQPAHLPGRGSPEQCGQFAGRGRNRDGGDVGEVPLRSKAAGGEGMRVKALLPEASQSARLRFLRR